MNINCISAVDGRYHKTTEKLKEYFSEYALTKSRVFSEIYYFIHIQPLLKSGQIDQDQLLDIYNNFSVDDAIKVKEIESKTNHDVKAVELFIRDKFDELNLSEYKELIHFGLTSQDINSLSWNLMIQRYVYDIYKPTLQSVINLLNEKSEDWQLPMLARTHGQAASPTLLSKEIKVFTTRLQNQLNQIDNIQFSVKFSGAVGNFNAHYVAYPDINWFVTIKSMINSLDLDYSYPTTQIEPYDNLAALFDLMRRVNTILLDFSRDIWHYISIDYFKQKVVKNEVGSSTMPHKVNPIDFENAEGNLGIANALLSHFSEKLPISRLQRDLTDSTVMRSLGTAQGHTLIAFNSLLKGIDKLIVNNEQLENDLDKNWSVVTEAIQTILRRESIDDAYNLLKDFSRNKNLNKEDITEFINQLNIDNNIKQELLKINPFNYTGIYE